MTSRHCTNCRFFLFKYLQDSKSQLDFWEELWSRKNGTHQWFLGCVTAGSWIPGGTAWVWVTVTSLIRGWRIVGSIGSNVRLSWTHNISSKVKLYKKKCSPFTIRILLEKDYILSYIKMFIKIRIKCRMKMSLLRDQMSDLDSIYPISLAISIILHY